jgi:hypothetical protein
LPIAAALLLAAPAVLAEGEPNLLDDRFQLSLGTFGASQDQDRRISEEINWGDETFPVDALVQFGSSFYVIAGVYDYSFVRRDTWELGANIGLHWTHLEGSLKAKAEDSGGSLSGDVSESASLDAPLPVLGPGYERFKVDVDVEKSDFNGSLDSVYDGPMIYYNASF